MRTNFQLEMMALWTRGGGWGWNWNWFSFRTLTGASEHWDHHVDSPSVGPEVLSLQPEPPDHRGTLELGRPCRS